MADKQGQSGFSHSQDVLTLLNRDLANEMNTMLTFMAGGLLARGADSMDLKDITDKVVKHDFKHVQKIAARIVELEGTPQLMPVQIQNNASIDARMPDHGEMQPILKNALECDLQSVVELQSQVKNIGFSDSTTRILLEEILADKEHEVEEIRNMMGL